MIMHVYSYIEIHQIPRQNMGRVGAHANIYISFRPNPPMETLDRGHASWQAVHTAQ